MIFGQDRQELRQVYTDAWRKSQQNEILSPLEAQVVTVIADHPEYHHVVSGESPAEVPPDQTNPFLHMSLHLALRDQVATDRPPGITAALRRYADKQGDPHDAEHQFMECLAEILWEAQNRGVAPDEQQYLERIRRLCS